GIRDRNVTGVQTCALPIWSSAGSKSSACQAGSSCSQEGWRCPEGECGSTAETTIQRDRRAWRVRTIAASVGVTGFRVRSARDLVSVPNDSVETQTDQGTADRSRTRSHRTSPIYCSICNRTVTVISLIQSYN